MKVYAEKGNYKCARLSPDDWQVLRDARISYYQKLNDAFMAKEQSETPEAEWRDELSAGRSVLVLFKDDEAIGHARVFDPPANWKKPPELKWMHIDNGHRGQHLSDVLYEGIFKFLAAETTHRKCFGRIDETRIASFRAAARNGMVHTRTEHPSAKFDDGASHFIVEKDLRPLREPSEP